MYFIVLMLLPLTISAILSKPALKIYVVPYIYMRVTAHTTDRLEVYDTVVLFMEHKKIDLDTRQMSLGCHHFRSLWLTNSAHNEPDISAYQNDATTLADDGAY